MSLLQWIEPFLAKNMNLRSRCHPLNLAASKNQTLFVKREDELSSGVIGSKWRKIASLLPFLQKQSYREILVLGGINSNNVLAQTQLLLENQLPFRLVLLEKKHIHLQGNYLYLKMLCTPQQWQKTIWVPAVRWQDATVYLMDYSKQHGLNTADCYLIAEGAANSEAIPGVISLAADVESNEKQLNLEFKHIFIDSGTAWSALGLIVGLLLSGRNALRFYVTLIASDQAYFFRQANDFITATQSMLPLDVSSQLLLNWQNMITNKQLQLYFPPEAKSFGSINNNVLREMITVGRTEGILMDPVYSIKHWLSFKRVLYEQQLNGPCLFINNSGALGLSGFQNKLSTLI